MRTMWEMRDFGWRRWAGLSDEVGTGSPPPPAWSPEVDGAAMVVDQWDRKRRSLRDKRNVCA